jgi:glutaredoxin
MKQCEQCAFDKDFVSKKQIEQTVILIDVDSCEHEWHNDTWDDMCCHCGIDAEYLIK